MADASAREIKEFFGIGTLTQFRKEWDELSDDEKAWFRKEVGKVVHPD